MLIKSFIRVLLSVVVKEYTWKLLTAVDTDSKMNVRSLLNIVWRQSETAVMVIVIGYLSIKLS